ncbi:MAG: type II toxin-antitoxin system HicB family antitoxin [Candidatus Kapaibacterium sp.]
MSKIFVVIEESPEGGYSARAMGYSIFTDAESLDEIRENIKDAIKCHFDEKEMPKLLRLHFVRDEVFTI